MNLTGRQVQVSAFYRDGVNYILRLYESEGATAQAAIALPFSAASAREVDFNGVQRTRKISVAGKTVQIEMKPWEIVTLAVNP